MEDLKSYVVARAPKGYYNQHVTIQDHLNCEYPSRNGHVGGVEEAEQAAEAEHIANIEKVRNHVIVYRWQKVCVPFISACSLFFY